MKLYWPMASYTANGETNHLFTYSPETSEERAREVIKTWASDPHYHIFYAWIGVFEDGSQVGRIIVKREY